MHPSKIGSWRSVGIQEDLCKKMWVPCWALRNAAVRRITIVKMPNMRGYFFAQILLDAGRSPGSDLARVHPSSKFCWVAAGWQAMQKSQGDFYAVSKVPLPRGTFLQAVQKTHFDSKVRIQRAFLTFLHPAVNSFAVNSEYKTQPKGSTHAHPLFSPRFY